MVDCVICKEQFTEDRSLHAHLKAHKLRMVEYYQIHFPRHDRQDGLIIKFKSKEQYFETDFNSAVNLKKWLESRPLEEAKEYCKALLVKRKERKDLIYTPTQVELRSLKLPGINYYNKIFGSYYKLCESLGFKNKFSNISNRFIYGQIFKDSDHRILIDTREQEPLRFKRPIEVATLSFGDYSFSDAKATCNCNIERKSLSDFIGTLTGGFERFEREIIRAKDAGAYLVILIEDILANAIKFNTLPNVYRKGTKVTPDFVFRRVRDLIQKYDHIQFLFVDGRDEASDIVEKIFTCGCAYKKSDLQYMYDNKLL